MRRIALLIPVVFAGACATAPMGPSVMVLPGTGISFEQFQADDASCREWASRQAGGSDQLQYDIAYQQCMYARNHQIPGVSPARRGSAPPPPAPASR